MEDFVHTLFKPCKVNALWFSILFHVYFSGTYRVDSISLIVNILAPPSPSHAYIFFQFSIYRQSELLPSISCIAIESHNTKILLYCPHFLAQVYRQPPSCCPPCPLIPVSRFRCPYTLYSDLLMGCDSQSLPLTTRGVEPSIIPNQVLVGVTPVILNVMDEVLIFVVAWSLITVTIR